MRDNMSTTKFLTEPHEYFKIINNKRLEVYDVEIVSNGSEPMVYVEYANRREAAKQALNTNVYHACFTTSQARLKLYSVLKRLGDAVLYYDTDSVVFVERPGTAVVELGPYLGDLTDEVGGKSIVEFASAGPKDYGYRLDDGTTTCKVKGFTTTRRR
eukprot:Lithocolla_globosa_v1_NODE_115_length_6172_cov_14.462155.p5 type:complete len:157 gc:universal NODE_115_length_6172_cov_14.462155:3681-3211(-)